MYTSGVVACQSCFFNQPLQVVDGIAELAWARPGQCIGVVALLAACGALLALQLWMIVLPLRETQVLAKERFDGLGQLPAASGSRKQDADLAAAVPLLGYGEAGAGGSGDGELQQRLLEAAAEGQEHLLHLPGHEAPGQHHHHQHHHQQALQEQQQGWQQDDGSQDCQQQQQQQQQEEAPDSWEDFLEQPEQGEAQHMQHAQQHLRQQSYDSTVAAPDTRQQEEADDNGQTTAEAPLSSLRHRSSEDLDHMPTAAGSTLGNPAASYYPLTKGARRQAAAVLDGFWGGFWDQHGRYVQQQAQQDQQQASWGACWGADRNPRQHQHQHPGSTSVGHGSGQWGAPGGASLVQRQPSPLVCSHTRGGAARQAAALGSSAEDALCAECSAQLAQRLQQCVQQLMQIEGMPSMLRAAHSKLSSPASPISTSPSPHSRLSLASLASPFLVQQIANQAPAAGQGSSSAPQHTPAVLLLQFGLWSLTTLLAWCQDEVRPELWGRYAYVLNKLQGLLRELGLDREAGGPLAVAAPAAVAAAVAALPAAGAAGEWQQWRQGAEHDPGGARGQQVQQRVGEVMAVLLDALGQLEVALQERRPPAAGGGSGSADVAYAKGKEVMLPLIKRLKRKLAPTAAAAGPGGQQGGRDGRRWGGGGGGRGSGQQHWRGGRGGGGQRGAPGAAPVGGASWVVASLVPLASSVVLLCCTMYSLPWPGGGGAEEGRAVGRGWVPTSR